MKKQTRLHLHVLSVSKCSVNLNFWVNYSFKASSYPLKECASVTVTGRAVFCKVLCKYFVVLVFWETAGHPQSCSGSPQAERASARVCLQSNMSLITLAFLKRTNMNGVSATNGVLKKMLGLETHALVRYVCVSGLYVCV